VILFSAVIIFTSGSLSYWYLEFCVLHCIA